jgi:hypothetical protein
MGVRSRRRQRKIKLVVFLYTMEKGRECREREREIQRRPDKVYTFPRNCKKTHCFMHIAQCCYMTTYTLSSMLFAFNGEQLQNKKFVFPYCTVLLQDYVYIAALFAFYGLSWACNFILLLVHSIRETFVVLHR